MVSYTAKTGSLPRNSSVVRCVLCALQFQLFVLFVLSHRVGHEQNTRSANVTNGVSNPHSADCWLRPFLALCPSQGVPVAHLDYFKKLALPTTLVCLLCDGASWQGSITRLQLGEWFCVYRQLSHFTVCTILRALNLALKEQLKNGFINKS